jgi:hypothetical protein
VPKISTVFQNFKGMTYSPRDEDFHLACPRCETDQDLTQTSSREPDKQHAFYACKNGCGDLVSISPSTELPRPGLRIGRWTVRNVSALFLTIPGKDAGLRFEPRAL